MPTYTYACANPDCLGEFDEFHSISTKLEFCPHCKEAGRGDQPVERLIASNSSRGIVELTGAELVDKMKADKREFERTIYNNENRYANLVGNERYHRSELARSKNKR